MPSEIDGRRKPNLLLILFTISASVSRAATAVALSVGLQPRGSTPSPQKDCGSPTSTLKPSAALVAPPC
jgi:hypothetical protein